VIPSEPAAGGHSEPSLAVIGDQAHDLTHEAYLAMALPPVLVNKPTAGRLGQRFAPLDCCHYCSWVRAVVAIPLVATGGIGTGAAIAAVLVAPRRQALTP
jgi:NAD(P)H-dependent flavin oxidoreductase YrpB (nitropropane dioxygenase family)